MLFELFWSNGANAAPQVVFRGCVTESFAPIDRLGRETGGMVVRVPEYAPLRKVAGSSMQHVSLDPAVPCPFWAVVCPD